MSWQDFINVLGADRYAAHALCLSNDPIVMTLFAAANLATFASYLIIGITLAVYTIHVLSLVVVARRLFSTFCIMCGLHHLCEVLTLFAGIYRIELMVDMVMAAASAVTAIMTVAIVAGRHNLARS